MKITKSQKIYLAGLCVGLCALALDQAYGSMTPAARIASVFSATPEATPGLQPEKARVADPIMSIFNDPASAKLDHMAPSPDAVVRDAFVPSPAWASLRGPAHAAPLERVGEFRRLHALRAIVVIGGSGQALIDGNLVAVGQSIDGFRLVSVGRLRAIFADGESRVELRLEGT